MVKSYLFELARVTHGRDALSVRRSGTMLLWSFGTKLLMPTMYCYMQRGAPHIVGTKFRRTPPQPANTSMPDLWSNGGAPQQDFCVCGGIKHNAKCRALRRVGSILSAKFADTALGTLKTARTVWQSFVAQICPEAPGSSLPWAA